MDINQPLNQPQPQPQSQQTIPLDQIPDFRSKFDETIAVMSTNVNDEYYKMYNFYVHLIARCRIQFETDLQAPAGVYFSINKFVLVINPVLFNPFSLSQRLSILKHEMLHICYNHINRFPIKVYNPYQANMAMDCAINQQIPKHHFGDLASEICLPENFTKMAKEQYNVDMTFPQNLTAEQYYELLEKLKQEQKNQKQNDDSDNSSDGDDGDGSGKNKNNKEENNNNSGKSPKIIDSHDIWERSEGSPQLAKEIAGDLLKRATQKARGHLPNNLNEMLEVLFEKPQINWQQVTRRIVGNKKSNFRRVIYKPNRRMPGRHELKGSIKDTTFELVVVVDESGSMSNDEIIYGLNEIRQICKMQDSKLKILHVDTEVKEISEFSHKSTNFNRKSSGGTHMYPAIEYLYNNKIQFDAILFITDGGIENLNSWDIKPNKPIIFLTTDIDIDTNIHPMYSCYKLNVPK